MFPQKPHSGSRRIEVDFTDILARVEEAGQPDTSELSRRERPPLQKLDRAGSVRLARIGWSGWTNIIFVSLASLGALFCAVYILNSPEHFRPGSHPPRELAYPGPATKWGKTISHGLAQGTRGTSAGPTVIFPGQVPSTSNSSRASNANPVAVGNSTLPSSLTNPNPGLPQSATQTAANAASAGKSGGHHSASVAERAMSGNVASNDMIRHEKQDGRSNESLSGDLDLPNFPTVGLSATSAVSGIEGTVKAGGALATVSSSTSLSFKQLNLLPRGGDALFQSLYSAGEHANRAKSFARHSHRSRASARGKVSSPRQSVFGWLDFFSFRLAASHADKSLPHRIASFAGSRRGRTDHRLGNLLF